MVAKRERERERELFESPDPLSLDLWFWCWLKNEFYKRILDTQHEFLARILDAAACIKKREDQFRRTTRDFRT